MLGEGLNKLQKGARDVAGMITDTANDAVREVRDLAVESAEEIRGALPSLEEVLAQAVLLPGASVSREEFLKKALKGYSPVVVDRAIAHTPVRAGIPLGKIRRLAGKALGREARRTTVASMAAGLPGGMAAAATIPADLIQLYAHLVRAIQMLSYLYGWRDACYVRVGAMDPALSKLLIVFLGAMAGDERADAELKRLAPLREGDAGTVLAAVAQSDAVDGIAQGLEGRMAHRMTGQVVGKSVPLAGAVISGTISYGGFSDMWKHLRDVLEAIA